STSGVLPMRSSRLRAVFRDSPSNTEGQSLAPSRHRRQEDDGVAFGDRRLVSIARADIFAPDVDVRVLELAVQPRKAGGQVVQQVLHGLAFDDHLALAACFAPQGGRDSNDAHARTGLQNST